MNRTVQDDTGLLLRVKQLMSRKTYRAFTRPVAAVLRVMPPKLNYAVGLKARQSKYPYALISPTDTVVQIGAPRDLLAVGRSRSIYFALKANRGHTIIIEPDPDNVSAMRSFLVEMGLASRVTVVPLGAWSKKDTLEFLSSPDHPASNALGGVVRGSAEEIAGRQYDKIMVPVDSVDAILKEAKATVPKIVSITTNGAEPQILDGMQETFARGCEYIAIAATQPGLVDAMAKRGLELVATDDRGFTFRVSKKVA